MIPDWLKLPVPFDAPPSRFSLAQRAAALAKLDALPVRWTPRPDPRAVRDQQERRGGIPNVSLAVREQLARRRLQMVREP